MFDFIDAVISYTEANDDVRAEVSVENGKVTESCLFFERGGVEFVRTIEELDGIVKPDLAEEYREKIYNLRSELSKTERLLWKLEKGGDSE